MFLCRRIHECDGGSVPGSELKHHAQHATVGVGVEGEIVVVMLGVQVPIAEHGREPIAELISDTAECVPLDVGTGEPAHRSPGEQLPMPGQVLAQVSADQWIHPGLAIAGFKARQHTAFHKVRGDIPDARAYFHFHMKLAVQRQGIRQRRRGVNVV
jgi:hypothetical protein